MLKKLLEQRNIAADYFQEKVYEIINNVEVFGIQATRLTIENPHVVVCYILDDKIYLKGLQPGETTIILQDEQNETAELKVTVYRSGAIIFDAIPCLKYLQTTFVYFRKIMDETVVAIDLKEALLSYLIAAQRVQEGSCSIEEVYYKSYHLNVLKDSKEGRFILGNHSNGLPILNIHEYALANRIVTLKFTKVNYLHKGVKKSIEEDLTITFIITDQIIS